jgi:diguanylate cyclase (GGDEF)-like protein/PAS domain S-box-containing protein
MGENVEGSLHERWHGNAEPNQGAAFLSRVLDCSNAIVAVFDVIENRTTYVSKGIETMLGYAPSAIVGLGDQVVEFLAHPEDVERVNDHVDWMKQVGDSDPFEIEYRARTATGEYRWLKARDMVFSRLADGRVKEIVGTAVDITDRKKLDDQINAHVVELYELQSKLELQQRELAEANARLEQLAYTDALTSLLNRHRLLSELQLAWDDAVKNDKPLSAIMLDVDHFKKLNDHFGHLVGDEVLKGVGETLKTQFRPNCAIGRYGGEEFLAYLFTSAEKAAIAADRLRLHIADRFAYLYGVTASFGVAERQPWMTSFGDLVHEADQALYRAKHEGRNRVVIAAPIQRQQRSA